MLLAIADIYFVWTLLGLAMMVGGMTAAYAVGLWVKREGVLKVLKGKGIIRMVVKNTANSQDSLLKKQTITYT